MDELPLVNEIRDARRRIEEASPAGDHLQLVESSRMALSILERHHQRQPDLDFGTLPGDDILPPIAERWTHLADMALVDQTGDINQRLLARRSQLDGLADALRPLSKDERLYSSQLHELRHEQHELLKSPKYAEQMAEVARIAGLRDELYAELAPKQGRLAGVAPSRHMIETFQQQLAWIDTAVLDERGVTGWRAATIASSLLEVVQSCLAETGFSLPVPSPGVLPETPDPKQAEYWLQWTKDQRTEIMLLGEALNGQSMALQAEVDALDEQMRQLNQRLVEYLG